jgi:hypothetical protein
MRFFPWKPPLPVIRSLSGNPCKTDAKWADDERDRNDEAARLCGAIEDFLQAIRAA